MATTKTDQRVPSKQEHQPEQLSARDEIELMLDQLSFAAVEQLGGGQFDGPGQQIAELWEIDEDDKGGIVLDVDVKYCNTRIPLEALLRYMNRENEADAFQQRLRSEPKRPG